MRLRPLPRELAVLFTVVAATLLSIHASGAQSEWGVCVTKETPENEALLDTQLDNIVRTLANNDREFHRYVIHIYVDGGGSGSYLLARSGGIVERLRTRIRGAKLTARLVDFRWHIDDLGKISHPEKTAVECPDGHLILSATQRE